MNETEIINGLLIYFDNSDINITKLVNDVGYSSYKKFQKALDEAYKLKI